MNFLGINLLTAPIDLTAMVEEELTLKDSLYRVCTQLLSARSQEF